MLPPTPPTSPTLKVAEIFRSLQGEGPLTGLPTTFIRLTGCALRCVYCDTAWAFTTGETCSLDAILETITPWPKDRVCVTGGEPLDQVETPLLLRELIHRGFQVSLETNGNHRLDHLPSSLVRVVDIKTPGSREESEKGEAILASLDPARDTLKFVLTDHEDYQWTSNWVRRMDIPSGLPLYLSPAWGSLPAAQVAQWLLDEPIPQARLMLPLHKVLWGNRHGV